MTRISRIVIPGLALAALWGAVSQGGEKAAAWKPFLPAKAYEELTRRSLARLGAADSPKQLRAEALLLAGYAMSTKSPAPGLAQQAVQVARLAADKKNADAARALAAKLAAGKGEGKGATEIKSWHDAIGNINDVMDLMRGKAKGGEGVATDLQYSAKLKNQNGIEALINALAAKKLSDANAAKTSKELELLGYRVATIGALTLQRGPADAKKGSAKEWNEQAVAMRDAAIELAEGARKKDGEAIHAASKRLENSCVECHSQFK